MTRYSSMDTITLTNNKKAKYSIGKLLIFIAVFFSSMVNAQLLGISLPKIALIPLELWLLSKISPKIRITSGQKMMIVWYFFTALTCLLSLGYTVNMEGYYSRTINMLVQILLIYLPIILLIGKCSDSRKFFIDCVILTAKINVIWAVAQFISWYGMQLDFNDFIFNDVLHGALGQEWTSWSYETGELGMRVSGLNRDTAFLSILLIFGVIFEKSWAWKTLFLVINFLSMSRLGIIVSLIFYVLLLRKNITKKIKKSSVIYVFLGTILMVGIVVYLLRTNAYIQFQVAYTIQRLMNIGSGDVGTDRHLLYPLVAADVWFSDFNLLQKLFGIGSRVGGTALAMSSITNQYITLSQGMKYWGAWAVECDPAELLLGNGVLGFFIYAVLFKIHATLKNSPLKEVGGSYIIPAIVLSGLMYNFLETTLIQLFIICMLSKNSLNEKSAS